MKRNDVYLIAALLIILVLAALYPRERSLQPVPTSPTPSASPRPFPTTVIDTPTARPLPLLGPTWVPITPYPTAETVKASAIAFVSKDWEHHGPSSLWIANADGSGEKQLVAQLGKWQRGYAGQVLLEWSPDGRWVSFISDDELWLASRNGSVVRRVLSLPDKGKGFLYTYVWSPDSSQIAYVQTIIQDAPVRHAVVGMLDVVSSKVSSSFEFDFPYTVWVSWLPNGKQFLLNGTKGLVVVDAATGRIVRGADPYSGRMCGMISSFDSVRLAPSGEWFAVLQHGNGIAGYSHFCIATMDSRTLLNSQAASLGPVWDWTGEVAYFTSADVQPWAHGEYDPHGRLMRFNARTQELQFLMPLETKRHGFFWPISISPDGRKLEMHAATPDKKESIIIIDLHSFSTVEYTLDLRAQMDEILGTAWSSDSQALILFAGRYCTPDGSCTQLYGAFYTVNIHTGKTERVSGPHGINEWAVSPP